MVKIFKFWTGISVLFFTFQLSAPVIAQQSVKSNDEWAITAEKRAVTVNNERRKDADSGFQGLNLQEFQKSAGGTVAVAGDSLNQSKENALSMDSTIALIVGFSFLLVLVVAIVAASEEDRAKD